MKYIKSNINLLLVVLFIIFSNYTLDSQPKGYGVLMQGRVIDITSGKSIGTTIMAINDKGKKWNSKSNSEDGSYQLFLNFGASYNIWIKGYLPENNHLTFDLTLNNKYEEITRDIYVKPITPNAELFKFRFFEPNDSLVINKHLIQEIKSFKDFNSDIKLNVIISSYDSYFKNSKRRVEKIDKKGRKSFKSVAYSTKEQLSDLLDARIVALRNEFKNNDLFLKQDAFQKDLQIVPVNKKQMKRAIPGKAKKYETYTPEFENVKIVIAR